MRRPVTLMLLLLFVAAELWGLRTLPTPATASSWERLVGSPAAVVSEDGRLFLLASGGLWQLRVSGGRWTAQARPLTWADVPEPSGAGFWRVAETADGRPLASVGAPVFPAPHGPWTLWVDTGSQALYASRAGSRVLQLVAPRMAVEAVRWAPGGTTAWMAGLGPAGRGIYRWSPTTGLTWTGPTTTALVASLGADRRGHPVAVLADGTVLAPASVMNGTRLDAGWVGPDGTVLGVRSGHLVRWDGQQWAVIPVPGLPTAPPRFDGATGQAAYVTRMNGRSLLVIVDERKAVAVDLPGADAVVAGWAGSAPVVAVLDGPSSGTYRLRTAASGKSGSVAAPRAGPV